MVPIEDVEKLGFHCWYLIVLGEDELTEIINLVVEYLCTFLSIRFTAFVHGLRIQLDESELFILTFHVKHPTDFTERSGLDGVLEIF